MLYIQQFGVSTQPAMVCYMTTVTFSTDTVILLLRTTSILLLFLIENFILSEWKRSERDVKPTLQLHLIPRPEFVAFYRHFHIHLCGVAPNHVDICTFTYIGIYLDRNSSVFCRHQAQIWAIEYSWFDSQRRQGIRLFSETLQTCSRIYSTSQSSATLDDFTEGRTGVVKNLPHDSNQQRCLERKMLVSHPPCNFIASFLSFTWQLKSKFHKIAIKIPVIYYRDNIY